MLTLLGLVLLAGAVSAQPSLYGPQPPPGAAFLRVVNATEGEIAVQTEGLAPTTLRAAGIGDYRTVSRVADRSVALEVRGAGGATARTTLRPAAGSFVAVLVQPAPAGPALHPVTDAVSPNGTRAHLAFYNAVPDCPAASLLLEPEGAVVFEDVPPGASRARGVNPTRATLRARCDARSGTVVLEGVEAGARYSTWLLPAGGAVRAVLTRDAVPGEWRPGRR